MEKKALIICASAGFLGLLSAALAFAAEATRIKVSDVQTILGKCVYPRRSPAVALGLLSAVALVIVQVIINSVACHMCCNHPNPSDTNWRKGLISFIASWGSFVAALVFLLSGATLNDRWGQEKMYFGELCYIVKFGVFSGGAILSLVSVSLAIVYYISSLSIKNVQTLDQQPSQVIPFGDSPHTPPAFLHEGSTSLGCYFEEKLGEHLIFSQSFRAKAEIFLLNQHRIQGCRIQQTFWLSYQPSFLKVSRIFICGVVTGIFILQ